ncbi:RDD family protein [Moraxella nasovis]|uniref:RDD family protein n=1 Tax=Moraxella nasovis TaxID=2904121 RepID=UPI001F60ADDF|nr:RDD family protein [Moraxella nasovis]UNU73261.1 RDD family protein [Moraxella nasovis]
MKIYLARNNIQAGPYGLDEINHMLASNEVLLTDLMWHKGMTTWQAVGEVTKGALTYQPNLDLGTAQPEPQAGAFGDNVEMRDAKRRISVAELYGKKPEQTTHQTQQNHTFKPTEPTKEPEIWQGRHRMQTQVAAQAVVYASVLKRFLATCVNMLLFIVAFMPFVQSFMALNPNADKLTQGDFEARLAYAQELTQTIDPTGANMTLMMLIGLLVVQLIMLIMRGQSIGKLALGIRIVDMNTHQRAGIAKIVGVRGVLLFIIYWIASAIPFQLNIILLAINYFMASKHPKKQGWHDRLAKTVVVKAHPAQLQKDK